MTEEPGTLDEQICEQITHLPAILAHSDDDTPIPTWKQVTRGVCAINSEMVGHLSRIVSSSTDEMQAVEVWDSWPGNVRRSVALLVDKIYVFETRDEERAGSRKVAKADGQALLCLARGRTMLRLNAKKWSRAARRIGSAPRCHEAAVNGLIGPL